MDFQTCIERVLGHEAGYVNNPEDPGGETKWGISKRSYPNVDIKNLSRHDAKAIYKRDFWDKVHTDVLPDAVDYQLLDSAVNSGIFQSIRFLQRALDVADDGNFGTHSRAAMDRATKQIANLAGVVMIFNSERLEYMTKLKNWPNASRGWSRRIALNLRYAAQDLLLEEK
jgi:lysozyme family protein